MPPYRRVLFVATWFALPALAQPTITNLDVLPGGSTSYAYASAISANGQAVTGYSNSSAGQRAFRWTSGGGLQDLGILAGFASSSAGFALSADGAVVTGNSSAPGGSVGRAFRWTAATGMQNLGVLGTGSGSAGRAVSADGSIIAGFSYSAGFNGGTAMRWTAATGMQSLGVVGSNAAAISADGSAIVGTNLDAGYSRAFRSTIPGGFQHLSILPGADSAEGLATSTDGSSVVGNSGDQFNLTYLHAVRWTSGGIQDLGVLGDSDFSYAYGVNADGSVVVGTSTLPDDGDHAFLWTSALGMVDLNSYLPAIGLDLTGWSLSVATGISANGSALVGNGTFNGATRAFLITGIPNPPPSPCYPNCDRSIANPLLNANDFQCFLNKYAAGDAAANCDASTALPILNANDFQCFLNAFAAGCP